MTDERASGIIVRVRPYSDTSLIVHWLTAEHGRLATMAKGVRRATSPLNGKLDLFYAGDLSFIRARRTTLHTLREFTVSATHPGVRADYARLVQAAYVVALLERSTETDTSVPEIHELFAAWLGHLDRHPTQPRSVFAFEARLLALQGFDPRQAAAGLSSAAQELVTRLIMVPWDDLPGIAAAGPVVRTVREFLRRRCAESYGAVPPSRAEAVGMPVP